jgi:HAMP domain-containing protein
LDGSNHLFERDLRVKVTAIMMALLLVALLAALIISYALTTHLLKQNVESDMIEGARMTRSLIGVGINRRETRMDLLTAYPVLRDRQSSAADKSAALALFTDTWPLGQEAIVVDTSGTVIAGTRAKPSGSVAEMAWFRNAQSAHISLTYVDNAGELKDAGLTEPSVVVTAPIRDTLDQIYAYAVSFTNISDVTDAIEGVRIGKTGRAFLLDRDGTVVASGLSGSKSLPRGKKAALGAVTTQMIKNQSGEVTVDIDGKKYLVSYASVATPTVHPELGWVVGIAVQSGEAYAPAKTLAWALAGLTVLLLIASAFAAFFLGRSITRPIVELADSAERMATGDLVGEVAIRTRDQTGKLAAALSKVRDYLRSTLGEASVSSERMSVLAGEQTAATRDAFRNIEDIAESVILLSKNMEAQAGKLRDVLELSDAMPAAVRESSDQFKRVEELLAECEILAEVGMNKAVEIASAIQEERAAVRDVASAANRLEETARELKSMVEKFKV